MREVLKSIILSDFFGERREGDVLLSGLEELLLLGIGGKKLEKL